MFPRLLNINEEVGLILRAFLRNFSPSSIFPNSFKTTPKLVSALSFQD